MFKTRCKCLIWHMRREPLDNNRKQPVAIKIYLLETYDNSNANIHVDLPKACAGRFWCR